MKLNDLKAPFIIADAGSNWCTTNNPSDNLIMAKRHIHDAAKAGCSAVKFQYFTDKELYGMEGPNKYHLPSDWLIDLAAYASSQSIEFMCTAFSEDGYRFINAFVNIHKVASSEMKHVEILKELARTNKPFLISTGGAHEQEVQGISQYLFGMAKEPRADFAFLECVANYPADPSDYNLKVLETKITVISENDEMAICPYIGVSDHTKSNVVALTSVGLGAKIFEKHFTAFDQAWAQTPDMPVSIGPVAMSQYVQDIKTAFKALGDGRKVPRGTEKDMTMRWRRRLKVIEPIKEGQILKFGKNFGIYRSIKEDAVAGPPEMWKAFDGLTVNKDLEPGDPVWHSTVEK
jgi:sialic acid synthase SpsE